MISILKRRVMIVDDDPDVIQSLAETLRRAGYEVVEASNVAEGVSPSSRSPVSAPNGSISSTMPGCWER
jgi:DNA-binding NtrC family response regulator